MQAIALLKAAIALLVALSALGPNVPDDLRQQVISVANSAITEANYQIDHPTMADETTQSPQGSHVQAPTPEAAAAPAPTPASQARIEIVTTDPSKPLDGTFEVATDGVNTWDEATSSDQFASLGAIFYNDAGDNVRDVPMQITSDDGSQAKMLSGTGNVLNTTGLYYYPFQYLFKTPGAHTVTFEAGAITESVTLNAQ